MTLTLEDVKNVRFPIAKRVGEGYRATEVDDFVDRVDATFGSMLEENERLKAQLEALDGSATPAAGNNELVAENERLKAELAKARTAAPVAGGDNGDVQRLRAENDELRRETADLRSQLDNARQTTGLTVMDGNQQGSGRVEKIVVSTAAQASPAVTRLVQLATEQAEAVVAEARSEADRTISEANAQAERTLGDAQNQAKNVTLDATTRAERIESAARVEADRLNQQARANSDAVNADAEKRRREMFSQLETERDQLVAHVTSLRAFENNYRSTLTQYLQGQLETVQRVDLEPGNAPQFGGTQKTAGNSSTPRLDALLAEGRNAG